MYAILKENRAIADLCRADRAMMADIHTRLEETFALTAEHKVRLDFYVHFKATDYYVSKLNIRLVAGELVLDPNRVRYTTLSVDVEVSILLLVRYPHTDKLMEAAIRSRSVRGKRSSALSIYLAT